MDLIKKNKFYLIGGLLGALGGYLYWRYVGCLSGSCAITSSPVLSTIWGTLIGGLLLNLLSELKTYKNKGK